jgi:Chitin synthase N-terminal
VACSFILALPWTDSISFFLFLLARRVQLTGGNLVLDCPVPNKYLEAVPNRDAKEFTHMRYTAATCDPSEFASQGYTLRQHLLGRKTELFIVMVRKQRKRLPWMKGSGY